MNAHTIAAAIGGLTIPGVQNLELGKTQAELSRYCPCLARSTVDPQFITDFVDQQITTQGNSFQQYTLNYKFFYAPVGADRNLFVGEVESVTLLERVIAEIIRNRKLGGAKYIALANIPVFQTISDSVQNVYHGAVISVRVSEF